MLLIAVIGMPCVLVYTTVVYWTFRGKVKLGLDHNSGECCQY
jgi:cytochrome d ubiquinol oxidase subunit II